MVGRKLQRQTVVESAAEELRRRILAGDGGQLVAPQGGRDDGLDKVGREVVGRVDARGAVQGFGAERGMLRIEHDRIQAGGGKHLHRLVRRGLHVRGQQGLTFQQPRFESQMGRHKGLGLL